MPPKKDSTLTQSKLYNNITKLMPIASIEAVIIIQDSLLLPKRRNHQVSGEWWFPDGRVHKGETLE